MTSRWAVHPLQIRSEQEESQSFQRHHRRLLCKPGLKKQKGPTLSGAVSLTELVAADAVTALCDALSFFLDRADSLLDSSAGGEGYCVLADQHMACVCLDTSYKQGLMSLLVQRHSGHSQTSQQQCAPQHAPGLFRGFSRLNDRKTLFPQFLSAIVWHTWVFWHT